MCHLSDFKHIPFQEAKGGKGNVFKSSSITLGRAYLAELHVNAGARSIDLSLSRVISRRVESIIGTTIGILARGTSSTIVEVELSRVVENMGRDESNVGRRDAIDKSEFNRGATYSIDIGAGLSDSSFNISSKTKGSSTVISNSRKLHGGKSATVVDELD